MIEINDKGKWEVKDGVKLLIEPSEQYLEERANRPARPTPVDKIKKAIYEVLKLEGLVSEIPIEYREVNE